MIDSGNTDGATGAAFRAIFRKTIKTVSVITASANGPVGFTATSVTSASVDPPVVTATVATGSRSCSAIETATHVGIHFLRWDQAECARLFAHNGADKFGRDVAWSWGPHGVPVLGECLALLLCLTTDRIRVSESSTLLVARPVSTRLGSDAEPLTYGDGRYLPALSQRLTAQAGPPMA